jgi:hypothetical protein
MKNKPSHLLGVKKRPVHRDKMTTSDIVGFITRDSCEECGVTFSKQNKMFPYGSLRVQVCRRCYMEKIK